MGVWTCQQTKRLNLNMNPVILEHTKLPDFYMIIMENENFLHGK